MFSCLSFSFRIWTIFASCIMVPAFKNVTKKKAENNLLQFYFTLSTFFFFFFFFFSFYDFKVVKSIKIKQNLL